MEYKPFNASHRLFEPVPLDTEGFRSAVNKASDRYWQNRTTIDLIETNLNMLDLDPTYEHIRQDQLTRHRNSMESILAGEGFLNGSNEVANMVKEYSNNVQLQTAVKNTQAYNTWKAELRGLVDNGKYDSEDYDDMVLRTTLPDLDTPLENKSYRKFTPDYAPERFDFKALYESVVSGYKPDSFANTTSELETKDSGLKFQDGSSYIIPSAKIVKSTVSNYSPNNEIGTIIQKLITSDPKAMSYLKHKVAIDLNKEIGYKNPISWRDINLNDPEHSARLLNKLVDYKEAARLEVTNNITQQTREDLDMSGDYLKAMRYRGNAYTEPSNIVYTGETPLMQTDKDDPSVKELKNVIGTVFTRSFNASIDWVRGTWSNVFGSGTPINRGADNRKAFDLGKAILESQGIPVKSMQDIINNKTKVEAYLKAIENQNSFDKQNATFLPFDINESNDLNIKAMSTALVADIKSDLTASGTGNSHRYIDLETQEEVDPKSLYKTKGENTIEAVGKMGLFHHLTLTAGESFYSPFIANINGKKYLVDNHKGVDQSAQGTVDKLTSKLYSNATRYSYGNTSIKVPVYFDIIDGIPTETSVPSNTSITFVSYTSIDDKGNPIIVFEHPDTKKQVTFNPKSPRFTETLYNINGSPKSIPIEQAFLYDVMTNLK